MDFNLTEEQTLLRDSVRRYIEDQYGFEARRKRIERGELFSSEVWTALADQGWIGAALPEAMGGFGGPIEAAIVAHELGRGLVIEPYIAVAVMAAQALLQLREAGDRIDLILTGEHRPVLAHEESDASTLSSLTTTARADGDGFLINGTKPQVIGGGAATSLLVSARTSGEPNAVDGISLFEVPIDSAGLTMTSYRLIDCTAVADIELHEVRIPASALIGELGQAYSALDVATSHATTILCAQAVGAMERSVEITRDYLRTRKQFGAAIGSFQALQHRLADMVIYLETARTMLYRALAYLESSPYQRRHAVAASKAQIGRSAKYIAAQGIQLHGGIGVTEEYSIGHYFKYLTVAESLLGNTAYQLSLLAKLRGQAA